MAENLSEHLKKFISLLLSKINGHPAAQSIIENLRKTSPTAGPAAQETEKRPELNVSINAAAERKALPPNFNQSLIAEKKIISPYAVIKESPFKLAQKTD